MIQLIISVKSTQAMKHWRHVKEGILSNRDILQIAGTARRFTHLKVLYVTIRKCF